jgi:hypothetical protein
MHLIYTKRAPFYLTDVAMTLNRIHAYDPQAVTATNCIEQVVVRHSDTTLALVSEVKFLRAWLVPGWVTVQGIPSHIGQLSLPSLRGR